MMCTGLSIFFFQNCEIIATLFNSGIMFFLLLFFSLLSREIFVIAFNAKMVSQLSVNMAEMAIVYAFRREGEFFCASRANTITVMVVAGNSV